MHAMRIERYTPAHALQWNDFVKTSKNGFFMFDRGYMDYHADRFQDHSLMVYEPSGKLLALLPANEREGVLYSHQGLTFGGFITGKKMRCPLMLEVFEALMVYLRKNGFTKMLYKAIPFFYHQQPAQEDIYALFRHDAKQVRVDASSTIDYTGRRYPFSSSRKSGLKKAGENGLKIVENTDFTTFFAIMNDVLEQKYETSATHSAEEMALLHSRFPNNITLHACMQGKEMLSGIITYETESAVHTQYIGSTDEGKALGAADLLLDTLINRRYETKAYFDFGISTEEAGRVLNASLIDQKEGTGARTTIHQVFEIDS